jgi:hypothetical protein
MAVDGKFANSKWGRLLNYGDRNETSSGMVLLSLVVMLAPALSSAQDATGRIFGTVYDQQGAVIPKCRLP